jgi:hypothetical protein
MINLQVQNIAAQGEALTLNHDCETGCIDLLINGGFSPYDVEWRRLVAGQWTSLTGWPKSALNGNDGVEDLWLIPTCLSLPSLKSLFKTHCVVQLNLP